MFCVDCLELYYVRILALEQDLTCLHRQHYVVELFVVVVAITDAVEQLLSIRIREELLLKSKQVVRP